MRQITRGSLHVCVRVRVFVCCVCAVTVRDHLDEIRDQTDYDDFAPGLDGEIKKLSKVLRDVE